MNEPEFVRKRVAQYYWEEDINCATTTLKILSETFKLELNEQVLWAATGMHGAGAYGAQCGLVEGTLMFLGVFARINNYSKAKVVTTCFEFAKSFENHFNSLQCRVLRPEGFDSNNPPHICEPLTCRAIEFSIDFILRIDKESMQLQND